jgi:hypothetical protein
LKSAFGLTLLLASAASIPAATINLSGTFNQDDDLVVFVYSVQNTGLVTVSTTSYATGGFQTILSLFDSSGSFLFDNSGYGSASDATLSWNSLGGSLYYVALTQYDNYALQPTLNDGFSQQGNGNFTATLPFNLPTPGGKFLLPGGEQRTGAWAVQFDSADPTLQAQQIPEPQSWLLLLSGALGLGWFGLRSRKRFQ